ncbi:MAG: hypothetical protein BGO31_13175 [Bacteroidetes bacterium 43-16]|nr:MAG: hypothetical protein BGO31_13175 [Bacteroidetes bacterium 43-16]
MNRVHIVVGDHAAETLKTAFDSIEQSEAIFVVKDVFNVGPLRSEALPFSLLRAGFWQEVSGTEQVEVNDLERLMELSTQLTNGEVEQVCFWMSGIPAELCTYFWLLHFLKKHSGKFYIINISGLPFIDDEGKLFYPEGIASLPLRQVLKAVKLARVVTPSEWETDIDEWKRIIHESETGIRISTGAKQIVGKPIDFYDKNLLDLAGNNNQKVSKLIGNAIQKYKIFTGDTFLIWRLKQLAEAQKLTLSKDSVKLYVSGAGDEADLFQTDNPTDNG